MKDLDLKEKNKKVALVGSATSSMNQAPWDDYSIDIWGLGWRSLKRCDIYFDIHLLNDESRLVGKNYIGRLSNLEKPVYLIEKHPEVSNSVRYPIEDIIEYLSSFDKHSDGDYFASSIAFMIALAMYKKYEEILLYGIDLLANSEYAYQRPNSEYLIGLARGQGISVYIPKDSAMCKFTHRYGYEDTPGYGLLSPKIMKHRMKMYDDRRERALSAAHTADGAFQEAQNLLAMMEAEARGSNAFDREKRKITNVKPE